MSKRKSLNYTIDRLIISALDPRTGKKNPFSYDYKNDPNYPGNTQLAGYDSWANKSSFNDWLNQYSPLVYDNIDTSSDTPKKVGGSGFGWAAAVDSVINIGRDLLGYAHADKAAQVAYNRQNEFYDEHLSMPAKVKEYDEAGLNPMALGAAGPGTTSAPSVQQGGTPTSGGSGMELLSALLNYKLKSRELDLQEEMLPAKMEQAYADAAHKRELADWVAPLAETNISQIQANTALALTKIGTEDSQRRLNEAGITETQAKAALTIEQAIYQEIQNKYADEWSRTEITLKKSQAALNQSGVALNGARIDEIYSNIETAVQERRLIKQKVIESGALTGLLNQEARNLNIKEEMLRFEKSKQNARFVLEQIEGYTSVAFDAINTAVNVGSLATGGGPLITPVRKPIGFKMN